MLATDTAYGGGRIGLWLTGFGSHLRMHDPTGTAGPALKVPQTRNLGRRSPQCAAGQGKVLAGVHQGMHMV